jgi:hypothetical protein
MSDVGDLLYEVTVRSTVQGLLHLDVGFALQTVLNQALISDVLERASKLAMLLVEHENVVSRQEEEPHVSSSVEHENAHGATNA